MTLDTIELMSLGDTTQNSVKLDTLTISPKADKILVASGCSSVWYERLVRDQEAAGSSPVIPTIRVCRGVLLLHLVERL